MTNDDTSRVRAYEDDKDEINSRKRGDDTQADVIRRLLKGGEPIDPVEAYQQHVELMENTLEDIGGVGDVDGLEDEIQMLKELVERVPENTADEVEGRFR